MAEFPPEIRTSDDLERLKSALKESDPFPHLFRYLIEIAEATEEPLAAQVDEALADLVRRFTTKRTLHYHAVPWSEAIVEMGEFKSI